MTEIVNLPAVVEPVWVEWTARRFVFNSAREIQTRTPTVMHLGPSPDMAVEVQLRSRAALDDDPLTHRGRIYRNGHAYFGGKSLPVSWGDPRGGSDAPVFEVRYRVIDANELPMLTRRQPGARSTKGDIEALRGEVVELGKQVDEQNVEIVKLKEMFAELSGDAVLEAAAD